MPAVRNAANRQSKRLSNPVAVPYDRSVSTETVQHTATVPATPTLVTAGPRIGTSPAFINALALLLQVGSVRYNSKNGTVARHRNAFVMYRSYFNKKRLPTPKSDRNEQTSVSEDAATVWNALSPEEKKPFQDLAERERQIYHRDVPDWSYNTNATKKKGTKSKDTSTATTTRPKKASKARKIAAQPHTPKVQAQAPMPVDHGTPAMTMDDSSRESSAAPSSPPQLNDEPEIPQIQMPEEVYQAHPLCSELYVPKKTLQEASIVKNLSLRPSATNYDQPGEQFGYKPQVWQDYIPAPAVNATTALDTTQSVVPTNPFVPFNTNINTSIIEPTPLPAPIQVVSAPTPIATSAYAYTPSPAPTCSISTTTRARNLFECPWDPTTEQKTWGVFAYDYLFHPRLSNPNPVTYDHELPFAYRDVDASVFLPPAFPSLYGDGIDAGLEGSLTGVNVGGGVGLTAQEMWEKERREHEAIWRDINLGLLD